jgi:DNA/RNA-binding domain of Phe-tRNA-synthetase-like protein
VLSIHPHPSLAPFAFESRFVTPVGDIVTPRGLTRYLDAGAVAPVTRHEMLRGQVRDLLRHGGYKPTGRGKPACEYLVKAASESPLRSINAAVDGCNAVSLHSGLPISVVDLDRMTAPWSVRIVEDDERYVFNASGQELRLKGLLCLHDAEGPCANAVKDSQRTKTHDGTRRTLSMIWGPREAEAHVAAAGRWYRELMELAGAETVVVAAPTSVAAVAAG